jgi:diguanylate cyclase (GGDEF)-like protein
MAPKYQDRSKTELIDEINKLNQEIEGLKAVRQESETLRQAGAVVTAVLEQQQAIDLILEQLALVVPYDSASVQLRKDDMIEVVGGHGYPDTAFIVGAEFPIDSDYPSKIVFKTGKPHILDNAPEAYSFFREKHEYIRAWMGVPLIIKNEVIGMLTLNSGTTANFNDHHANLAAAFADQVAIALENARLFKVTQQMAMIDPLTGLNNRGYFFSRAGDEYARAKRYNRPASIMMFDLDQFKPINDTYGHLIGDRALQIIAKRTLSILRSVDILGRYGGDEFIALLPETPVDKAQIAAERLRQNIELNPITIGYRPLRITLSVGVAEITSESESLEKVISQADAALLHAKKTGRNQVFAWHEINNSS